MSVQVLGPSFLRGTETLELRQCGVGRETAFVEFHIYVLAGWLAELFVAPLIFFFNYAPLNLVVSLENLRDITLVILIFIFDRGKI